MFQKVTNKTIKEIIFSLAMIKKFYFPTAIIQSIFAQVIQQPAATQSQIEKFLKTLLVPFYIEPIGGYLCASGILIVDVDCYRD